MCGSKAQGSSEVQLFKERPTLFHKVNKCAEIKI